MSFCTEVFSHLVASEISMLGCWWRASTSASSSGSSFVGASSGCSGGLSNPEKGAHFVPRRESVGSLGDTVPSDSIIP